MKKTTFDRICQNASKGKLTYIGSYAYDVKAIFADGEFTEAICRCLRDDIDKQWIDNTGCQYDGWTVVIKII